MTEIQTWAPENYIAKVDALQQLVDEIDRHRPLGPDGKHGNRHTAYCGCEEKPDWDKDLGDMTRFYTNVVTNTMPADQPMKVMNAEGHSMYLSISRSLSAFQKKRYELLLALDENVPDRLAKLGRTEKTIKEYEGLLNKLMGPLEARFENGEESNV